MMFFPTTGISRVCGVILALLLGPAVADTREAPRQYDIELLVFRNLVENDAREVWPVDEPDRFLDSPSADAGVDDAAPVQWLDDSAWRLKRHAAALRSSAQYRPVAHLAWRQAVVDRDRAQSLELPTTGAQTGGAWIEGSARVAVERYLHLYLDLQLRLPVSIDTSDSMALRVDPAPRFRLVEQRRMRSKELHYFDHPRFGVLALITPYTAPDEIPPDAGPTPTAVNPP